VKSVDVHRSYIVQRQCRFFETVYFTDADSITLAPFKIKSSYLPIIYII